MNLKKKKRFIRIIPRLDIKNQFLIKGINLEGLRVLGKPYEFAKFYSENGADEIHYSDSVASLYGTNNLRELVKKTAKHLNIPLSIGGGIRNLNDIEQMLNSGADKVFINSAFVNNLNFVNKAVKKFGSSTISASIEYIKIKNRNYITVANGRNIINLDPLSWSKKLVNEGVGELIITSVNHEGLMKGFDIDIVKKISRKFNIPVLAHGGAGNFFDILNIINQTNIDGVIFSSLLHYETIKKFRLPKINYIGNIQYLKKLNKKKYNPKISIKELKKFLKSKKLNIRNDF